MGENKDILEGVELAVGSADTPEIYIVFNGNVENVSVTINHFTDNDDEEE